MSKEKTAPASANGGRGGARDAVAAGDGGMAGGWPDDLIEAGEAAKLVFVKPQAIKRFINRGLIRGWQRGNRRLVSRSEVMALIQPIQPGTIGDK